MRAGRDFTAAIPRSVIPPGGVRSPGAALGCAAVLALVSIGVGACGGGGNDRSDQALADRSASPVSEFPQPQGQTLAQLLDGNEVHRSNLVASPTGAVYAAGENRFGFGIFTVAREQVSDADVALYAAPAKGGKAVGPFPARIESLQVEPRFESQTTQTDPDSAKVVYVTEVRFAHEGNWDMVALFHQGNGYSATLLPTVRVGAFKDIPMVGERPPRVHTPTAADVNGDLGEIDTRSPHDDMHDVDFADALGKQPIVLLFATPALCQSRVCGPVVDVAEQVKHRTNDGVAFIHQEVYRNNNASDGYRPPLDAFGLRSEPWLFVIDRKGIVRTRIEGAFDASELERAVSQVAG